MSRSLEDRTYFIAVTVAITQRNCAKLTEAINLKPAFSQIGTLPQKPAYDFNTVAGDYLKHSKMDVEAIAAWKQFIGSHYTSKVCMLNGALDEAFHTFSQAMHLWLSIYEGPSNSWMIPGMKTIAFNLVDIAVLADRRSEVAEAHLSPHKHCFEARGALESVFALMCRSAKKTGGLAVSNALCKLYFKLDEIQMAIVFQTRVDSQLLSIFEEFPQGDRAIWKYYNGLIALERLKFKEAEECLSYALEHSCPTMTRSIQKTLFLLISLRLLYNEFPKKSTLTRYGLQLLTPLVEALRGADIHRFISYLRDNESYLASMRIWSLMQKLYHVLYRNVLFKCYKFHVEQYPKRPSHQMDMKLFAAGLRISGMPTADDSDALSIARSLIQKDMVCGYVAIQCKRLVLAKNNPFPKLRSINLEAGEIFVETE